MHFWEDCYLVEIINPDTGEPVPEGEIGELVLTTLDREMTVSYTHLDVYKRQCAYKPSERR